MKKNLKRIWNIFQIFILIYVFIVTFLVININEYGYSKIGKSTYVPITKKLNKYLDNYKNGDLLIIKHKKIEKNDEIYYYVVDDSKYYISKTKVVEINDDFYKIESNFNIDKDRIVGNKVIKIGFFGFLLSFLLKEIGYFCFIILPMLVLLIYHIYDFSMSMRKLNDLRIKNIKRFYGDNETKMSSKDFNDSIKRIIDEIEILDEDDSVNKDDIEILDF